MVKEVHTLLLLASLVDMEEDVIGEDVARLENSAKALRSAVAMIEPLRSGRTMLGRRRGDVVIFDDANYTLNPGEHCFVLYWLLVLPFDSGPAEDLILNDISASAIPLSYNESAL